MNHHTARCTQRALSVVVALCVSGVHVCVRSAPTEVATRRTARTGRIAVFSTCTVVVLIRATERACRTNAGARSGGIVVLSGRCERGRTARPIVERNREIEADLV